MPCRLQLLPRPGVDQGKERSLGSSAVAGAKSFKKRSKVSPNCSNHLRHGQSAVLQKESDRVNLVFAQNAGI